MGVNFFSKGQAKLGNTNAVFSKEDIPRKDSVFGELIRFEEFVALFKGFVVFGEVAMVIRVKLAKNAVEIGAAAGRSVGDEVEIRRLKKNDGVLVFFG